VFTTSHPRVETPSGTAPRSHRGRATRIGATIATLALGGGFALAAPFSASADTRPTSYAEGQFLSGTLLGADLDETLALDSAEATNDGTQPTQVTKDPLDAELLEDPVLDNGEIGGTDRQIEVQGVLQAGPAAQYAEADNDGSSFAASGAVADDGAIGIGEDRSTPPSNATFDLAALLGEEFASNIADLKLQLIAVGASAAADLDTASGDYTLAGATLQFSSPAIAQLTAKVDSALAELDDNLADISNDDLLGVVNELLLGIDPALDLLGGEATVSASIDTGDLESLVHSLLTSEYGNGAVSFNLENGTVTIDLAALLGGSLNNLAPGTELLSEAAIDEVLQGILETVTTLADDIVEQVEEALHDANVSIEAHLVHDVAQTPIVEQVCEIVNQVVTTPVLGPILGNTNSSLIGLLLASLGLDSILDLGSLTDGIADDLGDYVVDGSGNIQQVVNLVNTTVPNTVCHNESSPLPSLQSSVDLVINGTVDQLLDGAASTATAHVKVLNVVDNTLPLSLVLDQLGDVLGTELFGDGGVAGLADALQTQLVDPAKTGLLDGDDSIDSALSDVVSVQLNVQESTTADGQPTDDGGYFTQTAARVSVLGTDLTTLNLAQARVGPNVTQIIPDPDPEDPTDPDGPNGPSAVDRLAFTGVGIATLIAVILALLAAGAYLMRESYRRNRTGAH
jgi:hypothetical protein